MEVGEKEVKHQTAQSDMKVGFGKYMEITCESINKESEWVSRMDTPPKRSLNSRNPLRWMKKNGKMNAARLRERN